MSVLQEIIRQMKGEPAETPPWIKALSPLDNGIFPDHFTIDDIFNSDPIGSWQPNPLLNGYLNGIGLTNPQRIEVVNTLRNLLFPSVGDQNVEDVLGRPVTCGDLRQASPTVFQYFLEGEVNSISQLEISTQLFGKAEE